MTKALYISACIFAVFLFLIPASGAYTYTFYAEPARGAVELRMRQNDTVLDAIYFNLSVQKTQYTVRIYEIGGDSSRIYDYFYVSTTGLESEPEFVVFDLKINKTWIDANSIDTDTISFYINDSEWERLSPVFLSGGDEFLCYRVGSPRLDGVFILTGEPVPIEFRVTSHCDRNGLCEPDKGEDQDNCPDCVPRAAVTSCIPSQRFCLNPSYLFVCNQNGTEYVYEECTFGCIDDACVGGTFGSATGMIIASNPLFFSVLIILMAVIVYLLLVVKRMRKEMRKSEEKKTNYEDVKALVKAM